MNNHQDFPCPYCSQPNNVLVDISAGDDQEWVTDCEVCCRPIVIQIRLNGENIEQFSAKQENE